MFIKGNVLMLALLAVTRLPGSGNEEQLRRLKITFEVDGQGKVTQMVLRTGGRTIPIKRIE